MEIVACGVPQYYHFQAGYYKHRRKTLFPIAVWNQFDNDGSINNYYFILHIPILGFLFKKYRNQQVH